MYQDVYFSLPKDLLTAETIWFSFLGELLIGPGKVYNYLGGGYQAYQAKSPLQFCL